MTDYYNKYLKYKTKYLELKSNDIHMIGGGKDNYGLAQYDFIIQMILIILVKK